MPNKYVQVDGVATFLHYRGLTTLPELPPATDRGETVVCLHDAGDNGNLFGPVLDALERDHSPMAFDQPAHARSGGLDSLGSVEAMARFAGAFCDKLGLGPAVFLGQGLGAAVACQLATDRPDCVRALALSGAASRGAVDSETLVRLERVTTGKARREFDRTGYSPNTAREVYGRAFGEWIKTDPRALLGDLRALDAWPGCATLAVPTLVLIGADEAPEEVARGEALAAAVPDAQVERIEHSGRRVALEQPAALAAALSRFLDGLPR